MWAGETLDSEAIEVWHEHQHSVTAFLAMGTQWHVAGNGRLIGLRYEALPMVLRYCRIRRRERAAVFAGLRIMERVALDALRA